MPPRRTTLIARTLAACASLLLLVNGALCGAEESAPAPVPTEPAVTPTPPAPVTPAAPIATPATPADESGFSSVPPDADRTYPIHVDLSIKYRLRWTKHSSDQDVYQYLNLDVGDPREDTVTGHLSLRTAIDIDGRTKSTGFYAFDSLADTYDKNYNVKLYSAYVDFNRLGAIELVRLGRQEIDDLPITLQFDGGRFDTWQIEPLKKLQFSVFGGVPVHLYEASSEGDSIYGAWAKMELWKNARVQVDWTHIADRVMTFNRVDEVYGVGLWQRFQDFANVYGRYNRLNDRNRDFLARGTFAPPAWEFSLQASYYALMEKQNALAIDIDPFTQALLTLFPYWEARLQLQKSLGAFVDLSAGGMVRRVFDPADISQFNREFSTAYATVSSVNWPVQGLEASLTWAAWQSKQITGETQTVSGDLGYRFGKRGLLQVGSSYTLYKYDFFLDSEREQVRTWYAKAWWKPVTWLRWEVRFEHESDSFGEYSDLSSSLRLQF